jgi:hypothetical protein
MFMAASYLMVVCYLSPLPGDEPLPPGELPPGAGPGLLPDPAGAVLLPWLLPFWAWVLPPLAGAGVAWPGMFPAGALLLPMAAGCPACGGSSGGVPAMPVWPVG